MKAAFSPRITDATLDFLGIGLHVSHILVVEDNFGVAPTLCAMLEHYGHTCSFAGDGSEALVALDRGGIDVVVSDVRLPSKVSGLEIADRARAAGIGCVLITGYGDLMSELERRRDLVWLAKPFLGSALAEAVSAAQQSSKDPSWRA